MKKNVIDALSENMASMHPVGTIIGDVEINESESDFNINVADMPLLPLRNIVPFQFLSMPLPLGRDSSISLCQHAFETHTAILMAAQKDAAHEDIKSAEMYSVGVIGRVLRILDLPDGTKTAFVITGHRADIKQIFKDGEYLRCEVNLLPDSLPSSTEEIGMSSSMLISEVFNKFREFIDVVGEEETRELRFTLDQLDSPLKTVNFICANAPIDLHDKQRLLQTTDFDERLKLLLEFLDVSLQLLRIKVDIQKRTHVTLTQQQKEHFLQQQIRTIQDELGVSEDDDIASLIKRADEKNLSQNVREHFDKELRKLERYNTANPEYSIQYSYLDNFLNLPWDNYSDENISLDKVEKILERDHYGLEKVKDRILEHMAVLKLRGDLKAPILCLFGPPGVGKTSLGRSIAESMGREYARISLGGLHDEAEIRGHRRTYIGAMPGRIISALEKCGTGNPVFVLDEIDKIGKDFKGDPSTALLEVLDPEQNVKFHDNYIDFDYDLSKVLFIATANNLSDISAPLLDRMEIITISGYITQEKVEIAKRHLIPNSLENNGFKAGEISFNRNALTYMVEHYTRESGVRQLEKTIGKILRKIALLKATGKEYPVKINKQLVKHFLGKETYSPDTYENNDSIGVVTGLAWTSAGGEILFIESSVSKGKGSLTMTGNLGDVMKESATIALKYLKANTEKLGIDYEVFEKNDFHVHVPEGAIPKDGPSAGITMATSLASALTGRKVRSNLAMTGEITLRGKVLPVGGIKEKILAAKRAGITDILLSKENKKDIEEIKSEYLSGLAFHYVSNVSEVLDFALI